MPRYTLDRGLFPASIATLLHATSAVAFHNGTAQAGGVANDTILVGLIILQNAASVTATVVGFQDETGTAQNLVFSGDTTALDAASRFIPFGAINNKSAMTVTASVADKVIVLTRPALGDFR